MDIRRLEMTQQLRALAALVEDWGSVASTHTGKFTNTCNFSFKGSKVLFWPSRAPAHRWGSYKHLGIYTYI